MATKKKSAAYTEKHKTSSSSGSKKSSSSSSSSSSSKSSSATKQRQEKHVKDIMTPRVVAVTSVTFLPEAAQIMLEEDVGALPVVQEDGKLLGIVTDRDITVRGVARGNNIGQTQVADVFTAEDLVTVTPDMKLEEAEKLMEEHQVRRLPVVGEDNKLMGILSLGDLALGRGIDAEDVLKEVSKPGGEHDQTQEMQGNM